MQFPRRNTLTFFAIALALVCILQMAPSARAVSMELVQFQNLSEK